MGKKQRNKHSKQTMEKRRWGFRHMQIKYKYATVFLVIGLLFLVAGGLVFWQLQHSQQNVSDIDQENDKINDMLKMVTLMQDKYDQINTYVAYEDEKYVEAFKEAQEPMEQIEKDMTQALSTYSAEINDKLTAIKDENETINDLFLNNVMTAISEGHTELAMDETSDIEERTSYNIKRSTDLTKLIHDEQSKAIDSADQKMDSALWILGISIPVVLLLGFLYLLLVSRPISRNLKRVTKMTSQIATGDLSAASADDRSRDEIGQLASAVNTMKDNLRNIVNNVSDVSHTVTEESATLNQSAEEVKAGNEQIASTMEELSTGAESQANSAADLSEEMSNFLQRIQASEQEGDSIAETSQDVAKRTMEGAALMNQTTSQMNQIDTIISDASDKVKRLDQQSVEISKLVLVIKNIADQTNLLSLNAAIEAARAGEHGKGFAVVADEVRKLAEQVAHSVTDITNIVDNIQTETNEVVTSLSKGYEAVKSGTTQMTETEQTFTTINTAVAGMNDKIRSISSHLQDISQNGSNMNNTIENIAAVSEESAAGVEQTAASAQQTSGSMDEVSNSTRELLQLAEQMNEEVQTFKL